jgi:hypothetical protein
MSDDEDAYLDTIESDDTVQLVRKRPGNLRTIRSSREYKKAHDTYRRKCAAHRQPDGTLGDPCVICTEPIDYSLKYPNGKSWSLEHPLSVKDNPQLLLDSHNWESAHFDCNSLKGADELVADTGVPSEDW